MSVPARAAVAAPTAMPMLAAGEGAPLGDRSFVTLVERLFGLWGYVAAWLLWRGYMEAPAAPPART